MLILLSPAKTMNMLPVRQELPKTSPRYAKQASELAAAMRDLSVSELERKLKISESLARLNHERYRMFDAPGHTEKQALTAYDGSVFKALGTSDFSVEDFVYAQNRLRIVSTLYGLLRPLDMIQAYRIAFNLKLPSFQGNLYDYWRPLLTGPLIEDVRAAGGILVNLASLDVQGVFDMPRLDSAVKRIVPEFVEYRNGKYETIRTYAKIARGEMTRYILRNRIETPEKLKSFTGAGFRYAAELSDDVRYVFRRASDVRSE